MVLLLSENMYICVVQISVNTMEANTLFENRYRLSKAMMYDFVKIVYGIKTYILAFALILLCAFYIWDIAYWKGDMVGGVVMLAILLFGLMAISPYFTARRGFKAMRKRTKALHGVEDPEVCFEFGDRIVCHVNENVSYYDYSQILKYKERPHVIALLLSKNTGIMLDPQGFTVGTLEDFRRFIEKKCLQVKKRM